MDDVSVAQTLRCGLTRGTLLGEHVLALILWVTAGGLPKTVLNWAVPHVAKMASHAMFQYNVLVIDIDNTTLGLI